MDLFNHCFTSNYIDRFLKPLNLRSFEIDFDNMVSKIFFLEMRKWKNQCLINCEFFHWNITITNIFILVLFAFSQSLYLLPLSKSCIPSTIKHKQILHFFHCWADSQSRQGSGRIFAGQRILLLKFCFSMWEMNIKLNVVTKNW